MPDTSCQHCRHYTAAEGGIGECRRYPPTLVADEEGTYSAFPHVAEDAVCGEFSRKVM